MNSIDNRMQWDDINLLMDNPRYMDISLKNIKGLISFDQLPLFIPSFFWMLDYKIKQNNPSVYRISQLFLHSFAVIAFFFLILNITDDKKRAFLSALFFSIHPIQTEAVLSITNRAVILFSIFTFSSLIFFWKFLKENRISLLIFSLILYFCSILSLEFLPLTFLLILLIQFLAKRRSLIASFLFLLINIFGIFLWLFVKKSPLSEVNIFGYFYYLTDILKLVIFPFNLNVQHKPYPYFSIETIVTFLIILALIAGIWFFRKNRIVVFGISWYLLMILPFWGATYTVEAKSYLAFGGIAILFGILMSKLFNSTRRKDLVIIFISIIFVVMSGLTYARVKTWSNIFSLWEDSLKKNPENPKAFFNIGIYYMMKNQDYQKAVENLEKSISINPENAKAYIALGLAYKGLAFFDMAYDSFEKALMLNPGDSEAYLCLGDLYASKDMIDEAEKYYKKALDLNPYDYLSSNNLALLYIKIDEFDKAEKWLKKSIKINPKGFYALRNLGILYLYYKKEYEKGINYLKRSLSSHSCQYQAYFIERIIKEPDKSKILKRIELELLLAKKELPG